MELKYRILIILFYLVLITTLLFGLWPLNLWPQNEVHWLKDQNGIELHRSGIDRKYAPRGISYTDDSFRIPNNTEKNKDLFSIELYIQSKKEPQYNIGTIVAFWGNGESASFLLAQWKKWLILRTPDPQSTYFNKYKEVGISEALPRDSTRYITITSGPLGTKLYLDGIIKRHHPNMTLVSNKKSIIGQMVIGITASGKKPWAGNIFGIGVHEDTLSALKIKNRLQAWRSQDTTTLAAEDRLLALYTFDEGEGLIARNKIAQDNHLQIPKKFTLLKKIVLEPPWVHFSPDRSFLFDLFINLLGFIPLGIMLAWYLNSIFKLRNQRLYITVLVLGGSLSLIIELLQILMPQRNSSLLDLILNISGLYLGILLIRFFQSRNQQRISI